MKILMHANAQTEEGADSSINRPRRKKANIFALKIYNNDIPGESPEGQRSNKLVSLNY